MSSAYVKLNATMHGSSSLQAKLRARREQAKKDNKANVVVDYTAPYAIYVHEDLAAFHRVGQAKYLEQPLKRYKPEMRKIIMEARKAGGSLAHGLMKACIFLRDKSRLLVPVDTGFLRASGTVKLTKY